MIESKNWSPDDFLKAVALIGAIVAFIVGLLQYRKAQQWKRAEWVAQEMKQLFNDPIVQSVLLMIDWGARRIMLYPEAKTESEKYVWLTDEDISRALMPHEERPEGFTDQEAIIRAAFDRFLDGLERFHSYVQTGLVSVSDVYPYLKYWADNICTEPLQDGTEDRLIQLKIYMEKYGFRGAYSLLQRIAAA
jgi:hypothetical protein